MAKVQHNLGRGHAKLLEKILREYFEQPRKDKRKAVDVYFNPTTGRLELVYS